MSAEARAALFVAIAGVLAALAAIPDTAYRTPVLIAAAVLILFALLIGVVRRQPPEPSFAILTPTAEQGFSGGGVLVSGTIGDLESDTLWIFEEGVIDDRRVWLFGGDAFVNGHRWSFEYEPKTGPNEKGRRTLTVVRADRSCERHLRSIRPDSTGRRVVYDPAPGGCEVLGQISIVMAAQP